jgi:tetratricopeptide (TPR) repeat protein
MGVVCTDQGRYAQAQAFLLERLQIDLTLDDRLGLAKTIGNLGVVYAACGEYDHALACCHCLLRITLELGDRQNAWVAAGNMIGIYAAQHQYALAERLSRQAIALGRVLNVPLYLCEFLHDSAALLAGRARYAEAQSLNDEAVTMAARYDRPDVEFNARLLELRLRLCLGQTTAQQAAAALETLLATCDDDEQQAMLIYERWRIDRCRASLREQAAALFTRLYAVCPRIIYRQRYAELTGATLPEAPCLPAPPELVLDGSCDLDSLLARLDQLAVAPDE